MAEINSEFIYLRRLSTLYPAVFPKLKRIYSTLIFTIIKTLYPYSKYQKDFCQFWYWTWKIKQNLSIFQEALIVITSTYLYGVTISLQITFLSIVTFESSKPGIMSYSMRQDNWDFQTFSRSPNYQVVGLELEEILLVLSPANSVTIA